MHAITRIATGLLLLLVCVAMPSIACDRDVRVFSPFPTSPAAMPQVPAPPVPPPSGPYPPSAFPGSPFSESYTPIAVGARVSGRVNTDDPRCVGEPSWQCQYFRLTAPADGVLEIAFTVLPHPTRRPNIDLSFSAPDLRQWWAPVTASVSAGVTYQITLWEYEFPGAEFELQATLREK